MILSSEKHEFLIQTAKVAAESAYAPYSNYFVGAALLTESGEIFTGCNIENRVLGGSICAERTAIVKAVSEGHRKFQAIAVHCKNNEGWPCGVCRQFIAEFGLETQIIVESDNKKLVVKKISELLPEKPVGVTT